MNIMNWLFFLMALWNGLAAQGCQYDYVKMTWNCPSPTSTQQAQGTDVINAKVPVREGKREGQYPQR